MEISHARPYPFLLSFGWVPIQEGNLMYAHTLRFGWGRLCNLMENV
jgi:hypothetical protein